VRFPVRKTRKQGTWKRKKCASQSLARLRVTLRPLDKDLLWQQTDFDTHLSSSHWRLGSWCLSRRKKNQNLKTNQKKIRPQLNLTFLSIRCCAKKSGSNAIQNYLHFILKQRIQSKYTTQVMQYKIIFIAYK
jgi:hypothetical protein